MDTESLTKTFNREGDRMRVVAPIGTVERSAVPLELRLPQQLVECEMNVFSCNIAPGAKCDQQLGETVDISVVLQQGPVQPADLIVLAVCIVVPILAASRLVAHQHHRGTECDHG